VGFDGEPGGFSGVCALFFLGNRTRKFISEEVAQSLDDLGDGRVPVCDLFVDLGSIESFWVHPP
jgi:hypothetical protein